MGAIVFIEVPTVFVKSYLCGYRSDLWMYCNHLPIYVRVLQWDRSDRHRVVDACGSELRYIDVDLFFIGVAPSEHRMFPSVICPVISECYRVTHILGGQIRWAVNLDADLAV